MTLNLLAMATGSAAWQCRSIAGDGFKPKFRARSNRLERVTVD
jgi:hypothetical protein